MKLLKTAVAGTLAYLAWRSWQRRRVAQPATGEGPTATAPDAGATTPPHGDPTFPRAAPDLTPAPAGAQSSRGFGEA